LVAIVSDSKTEQVDAVLEEATQQELSTHRD
jgi:hypothetical protein